MKLLSNITLFSSALALSAAAAAQQGYEEPRRFKADEFAPPALLRGPLHSVDETIGVDAGLARFVVRSRFGTWDALGLEMLDIRVSELPALEQLEKVNRSDEFAKAAGQALTAPVEMVGTFLQNPADTTGSILTGLGTMVGRVGRTVGSILTNVGDSVTEAAPQQKPILQPQSAPLGTGIPRSINSDPLGYNDARRGWAQRLKVDAYSFNAGLSERLDKLASVTFAGSFAVGLVVSTVAAPLYYAEQTKSAALAESYQLPPADIEARNEERLKKMGVEGPVVRTLFRNAFFTPTLQTALVLGLENLGDVAGRADVVAFAARAASENDARYVNNAVLLLAQHGRRVEALARVRVADNFLVAEAKGGRLLLSSPLDYMSWAKATEDLARRDDLKAAERWLLSAGRVSPRAVSELAALGWRVSDRLGAEKRAD